MGLLNTLTGSVDGAFSLSRYLATAFEGSAVVRLREDNGSTEQDFKLNGSDVLVSDDVNEDTVSTWLTDNSASNAYVVTWYDQSGNTRDYSQATASQQPLLVQSGINSLPTMRFLNSGASRLSSAASYEVTESSGLFVNAVSQVEQNAAWSAAIWSDANTTTLWVGFAASLGGWHFYADNGQTFTAGTTTINTPNIVVWERPTGANPVTHTLRVDGTEEGSSSLSTDARAGTHSIGQKGGSDVVNHTTAELIFTNSVLSTTDRGLIEADQGTQYNITIAGAASAAITGTMIASVVEGDIVTGGKTIIITLTGDTFVAAGTGAIGSTADTQALIDGFDAASSPANGWNNEVRDKALTSEVVRTSDTVATWTVSAQSGYDVSAQETITGTIPAAVLTLAAEVVSIPTFTIDFTATFHAAWARNINTLIGINQ